MWSGEALAIPTPSFLLAGFVKGVVGLGLPTVSLAILAATLGLREAMILMLMPSLVTNVWQALAGGSLGAIIRRLWPALAASIAGTWLAAGVMARSDAMVLSAILGVSLCVYAGLGLTAPAIPPPGNRERWLSPLMGGATGVLTGLTGSFAVPAVPYLHALAMPRDMLIQAMGVWFTVATATLAVALKGHDLLPADLGGLSTAAVAPALVGMVLGQRLRRRLPEGPFRLAFFMVLLILGGFITARALF